MASFWNGIAAMGRNEHLVRVRAALARLPNHAAFWLKAFSQQNIDLTLRTHTGLQTRIVESPGLSLSQQDLDALTCVSFPKFSRDQSGAKEILRATVRLARETIGSAWPRCLMGLAARSL